MLNWIERRPPEAEASSNPAGRAPTAPRRQQAAGRFWPRVSRAPGAGSARYQSIVRPSPSQLHLGLPAGDLADLGGIQELVVDFALRVALAANVRLDLGSGELADQLDHLPHRIGVPPAGVEGFARAAPLCTSASAMAT